MQNIEIKAKLEDRKRVERQLTALGARPMWVRSQRDTFFSLPEQVGPSGWLKLREVEGRRPELISYRRVTDGAGPCVSDYDIVILKDVNAWHRLLGRVLPVDKVVEKERALWLYENTRVHLDKVSGLGDFLELETVVQGQGVEEAEAETSRLMNVLRIQHEGCIDSPYRDLVP